MAIKRTLRKLWRDHVPGETSEKSSEAYFDGNNQNISYSDNKNCLSNSSKSSQVCPCSLVCKTVGAKKAPNCQTPQYVETTTHKCNCQNFNLPSSSSSNSLPCEQFPVKLKLNSEDRYAYLKNVKNIQSEINAVSFRPERLQPNVLQNKMIYEEFFSCSSSEDSDEPTECPCYSRPFRDKNLVILELLHEVVHLINDDNPIRDEAMRITNAIPSGLDIKCSKTKQQEESSVMNKDLYPEIGDRHLCPFCNQGIVCGPGPSLPSHAFIQPVGSTCPEQAVQQIPEPFVYEDSYKDCFSSAESCICSKINDVCPRHGPLKILLNKLQCQTEKDKQQCQFDDLETPTKSSRSARYNPPECFSLNGPCTNKSAPSPVPYPPECSYLNGPGSTKSSRSTRSNPLECFSVTKSARSPVPYPPECSYLNGPGSTKSSRSTRSNPPECFSITGAGPTKSTRSPTPSPPECAALKRSDQTKIDNILTENLLTFDENEPSMKESAKDVVARVSSVQESVEDFRVYRPCQDCLMEYDDEEPWPCSPPQISTTEAAIARQIGDVEKPVTQAEREPSDKLEESQEKEPSDKLEECQENMQPDQEFTENTERELVDELEENIEQNPSDNELCKSSTQMSEEINKTSEFDHSQNDTEMEKLAESEQLSLGESKTGCASEYGVEEMDDENELAKERIAESLKTKEQQEEEEYDGEHNTKTSDRSFSFTKQIASTSEVCERKERDGGKRDGDNNRKYSDTTVATIKRTESEGSTNEMKYFIDSLITDLNAMDYARRRSQFEQNVCKTYGLCARDSFPVTITNVSDLGTNSLYVQWKIHDCFGIGGYEIYTDGYLTNRYYNSRHDAAVITNVDVTLPHKIALVAQSCANDESIDLICNINRDKNKPKSLQWKTDEEKGRESYSCLWTPSIFLYDPNTCKASLSAH